MRNRRANQPFGGEARCDVHADNSYAFWEQQESSESIHFVTEILSYWAEM
jgi:hypothetical protein